MPIGMDDCGYGRDRSKRKVWRYPGVPIPYRLTFKYFDPTVRDV